MGFSKAQILVIFFTSNKLADKQNVKHKTTAADNENSQFSPLKGLSAGAQ